MSGTHRTTTMSGFPVVTSRYTYDLLGCYADGECYCFEHCPRPGECEADHGSILADSETDAPEHCTTCQALIDSRLTNEGMRYVREAWEDRDDPMVRRSVLEAWRETFAYAFWGDDDDDDGDDEYLDSWLPGGAI